MFRSLFAKYILTFVVLVLVSVLIIGGVFASLINAYSLNLKQKELSRTAEAFSIFIHRITELEKDALPDLVETKPQYFVSLSPVFFPSTEAMNLLLLDKSGGVLMAMSSTPESGETVYLGDKIASIKTLEATALSDAWMKTLLRDGTVKEHGNADGFLTTPCLIHAETVKDARGNTVGAVLVYTDSLRMDDLLNAMTRTMTVAGLWITLAALVAVYILSERIISPLKQMSRAAKHFASGQFDIRVKVVGSDEVAELATAFNHMADSIERNEDMRRTFLANVSHDLRTPMTTISGYIDSILDGAIKPEEYSHYLGIISREVKRLSRLVTSLLDISRMQAGERKFDFTTFDACELARQVLISFEQKITAKHLEVEFDCDRDKMMVCADRDAVHQVLYNLCDNAVKFSRDGGHYLITLRDHEDKVHLSVFNEGEGIPQTDLPYVFDRFYKSDKSRGLDKTGVGLGLYICRTIIESHGEKIWVESDYGNNCMFTFSLRKSEKTENAPRVNHINE